eukprot:365512-Chlamydomonas_euryale.AAC.6
MPTAERVRAQAQEKESGKGGRRGGAEAAKKGAERTGPRPPRRRRTPAAEHVRVHARARGK